MGVPVKRLFALAAAVSSYLLVSRFPENLLFSKPTYFGTFIQLWLLQFAFWGFWTIILYPKFFSPLRHFPGPKGGSFIHGQFHLIRSKPTGAPARDWVNTIPNEGIIRYLGFFNRERLLITSPKALSEVLTKKSYEFIKPPRETNLLARLLGYGVLLAEGEEHKRQRKNLQPAFAFRNVKNLYPMFWEKSKECVLAMSESIREAKSEGDDKQTGILEVSNFASRCTLDIIGTTGLGRDFGAIRDPNNEICQAYMSVFSPPRHAALLFLLNTMLPYWFTKRLPFKRNGDIEKAAATIRNVCQELIENKRVKLQRGEVKDQDLLSIALESGAFSDENLTDQVMTFLAAGHETTASAMTFAIYILSRYPEVQSRLRAEIRGTLPSPESNGNVTSEIIDDMPYLNAVVNEVLRYFPPVPMTLREAAVPTTIAGHYIPKGTMLFLCPWAINHDKALWGENASEFVPERWLTGVKGREDREKWVGNGGAESVYAMMTFLHGPRSCIGQGFAKAEFACILATWVGRFHFELRDKELYDESKLDIKSGITAKPANFFCKAKIVEGW